MIQVVIEVLPIQAPIQVLLMLMNMVESLEMNPGTLFHVFAGGELLLLMEGFFHFQHLDNLIYIAIQGILP